MAITSKKRKWILFAVLNALLIAGLYISLFIGKYPLSTEDISGIFFGGNVTELKQDVFWTLRMPRSLTAILAGAGLAMAGGVFQVIFKNPLATPDIVGVASGANLGTAIAIVLLGYHTLYISVLSFAGALLAALLVILLTRLTGTRGITNFILAGIAIKAATEALIMVLKIYADPERELAALEYWSMGSLKSITLEKLIAMLPLFLIGFAGLVLLRRQIALLALEEAEATMLGLPAAAIRILVVVCAVLVVASIISVTGMISFIGLLAPHIAKLILRRNSFFTLVTASYIGALVLLAADCASRMSPNAEMPISVYTSLVGIPLLIFYLVRRRRFCHE